MRHPLRLAVALAVCAAPALAGAAPLNGLPPVHTIGLPLPIKIVFTTPGGGFTDPPTEPADECCTDPPQSWPPQDEEGGTDEPSDTGTGKSDP